MPRKTHLGAARQHGRKAINELRHMTADSALYWVLSHKSRVAQFRRAVRGTRAAKPFERLLTMIREQSTSLERARPRRNKVRARARARRKGRVFPPTFLIG